MVVLKAGHAVDPSHPYHRGLVEFAKLIENRTNGKYRIDLYPSAQLGNERDMIEELQLGTLDLVVTSTGPVSNFVPRMGVVDLSYLFKNRQHAYTVLDGPIGESLLEVFKGNGIVGLAFWENGFRCLTNSRRPIKTPEDVKGLKIRTMENIRDPSSALAHLQLQWPGVKCSHRFNREFWMGRKIRYPSYTTRGYTRCKNT
jgi:TRAP-type C4-dicarboxylate transport system, periplasmic component